MSLTYDKLSQLATGLHIDIAGLFHTDGASSNPVMARHNVERSKDRTPLKAGQYVYWYLNTGLTHKTMTPMLGRTKYRSMEQFGDYIRHPGEEFVFVVEGKVAVHTEHYEAVVLSKGDSLYFDSTMGHAYLAVDDGPCLFVSVCTGSMSEKRFEPLKKLSSKSKSAIKTKQSDKRLKQ